MAPKHLLVIIVVAAVGTASANEAVLDALAALLATPPTSSPPPTPSPPPPPPPSQAGTGILDDGGYDESDAPPHHTRIVANAPRGKVEHKWPSSFLSAKVVTDLQAPLLEHVGTNLIDGKSKPSSDSTVLRGWVGSLVQTQMGPEATAAYAALQSAVQVAFSRFREQLTPVKPTISGAVQLTNVEAHVLPAGKHSYELAYTARNPLGFTGLFVVQAERNASMTFTDPSK